MTQREERETTWEERLFSPPTKEEVNKLQAESDAEARATRGEATPEEKRAQALAPLALEYDQATGIRLQPPEVLALVAYAERYRLDAFARHVIILYGAPYLTEVGAIANARRDPKYRGFSCRNLQPEELEKLGEPPGSRGWLCSVWMDGYKEPVEDYGVVTAQEVKRMAEEIRQNVLTDQRFRNLSEMAQEREIARRSRILPLLASPSKIAKARAIRRAHERAVPLDATTFPLRVEQE